MSRGPILLSWLSMIAFDFFLHAGLLKNIYRQDDPFLLDPKTAFYYIPLGYLSFLLIAVLLYWLQTQLNISEERESAIFGLKLGGLTWGALILGLFSIANAPTVLLIAWFFGQTIEIGIGAYVMGRSLEGDNKIKQHVGLFTVVMLVLGVIIQNLI